MRALLVLAFLVAGCDASSEAPPVAADVTAEAQLVLGESGTVDGVAVTFEAVETDSRCPDTAMCIWPGVALVDLALDGASYRVRVAGPERDPRAGVRVDGRVVFATALTRPAPEEDALPVVTVVTTRAQ